MSDNLVICPNCVHQFRAISVSDQERIAKLQAVVDAAKALTEGVDCYDNYGDLTEWNDRLKQAIKEVE